MCDPLTIASAVATVGGSFMQMQSQKKAEKKTQQALSQNAEAQERLRQQSQNEVLAAGQEFNRDNLDKTQDEETAKIEKTFKDNLSQGVLPGEYYGGETSENTRNYQTKQNAGAMEASESMTEALAKLRGFGQGFGQAGQQVSKAGERVTMNNGFMDGNNAVLPIQLEAAKAEGQNPFADILVGAGSAGLTAGLTAGAGGLPAGATATGGGGYITKAGVPVPGTKPTQGGAASFFKLF